MHSLFICCKLSSSMKAASTTEASWSVALSVIYMFSLLSHPNLLFAFVSMIVMALICLLLPPPTDLSCPHYCSPFLSGIAKSNSSVRAQAWSSPPHFDIWCIKKLSHKMPLSLGSLPQSTCQSLSCQYDVQERNA